MDKKDGVEQVSTATNDAHAADNIFVDTSMATMNTLGPTDVLLLIIVILQNSLLYANNAICQRVVSVLYLLEFVENKEQNNVFSWFAWRLFE